MGGLLAPTFPGGYGYQAYYDLNIPGGNPPAAPSGLIATAVSSSQIDLSWTDNSSDETTFDIERSSDGTSFSFHDFVGADTTSYSDTGLTASTTLHYRVSAANGNGSSAYSEASATTQSAGTGTSVRVDSITVTTAGAGRGFKRGRATVVVRDDLGGLVENATVNGEFSGDITDVGLSGITGSDGSTVIDSDATIKGKVSNLTFCVTSITHASLADYTGLEVCKSL